MVELARANRAFLGRAVRFLAGDAGIRQFLDVGTGIPAADNTHQVAQEVAPDSRVVYVDYDPVVLAHARTLLASGHRLHRRRCAQCRHGLGAGRRTLDFSRPVAAISLLTLHAISDDDDPQGIMARIMDAVPAGSYLAISHPASDIEPDKVTDLQCPRQPAQLPAVHRLEWQTLCAPPRGGSTWGVIT